jgi:hypothetical protein
MTNSPQICFSLFNGVDWLPLAGDDCDNTILASPPNGIFGIGISLKGTSTTVTYDVYTIAGALVGTGTNGNRIGNAATPITGVDIQFGPRNLHLTGTAFDKNLQFYPVQDNKVVGNKTDQLIIMQLALKHG